jgi:hypothetical protein
MMMPLSKARKGIIISLLLLFTASGGLWAQGAVKQTAKASGPEVCWAIGHPFIAIKAKRISKRALQITDSIEQAGIFSDRSGGNLDAFKHSLWMALLSRDIKPHKALKLGKAHERFNRKQAKKGKGGGDAAASTMDLWNNKIGAQIGSSHKNISEQALIKLIIDAVKQGEMRIVRKNAAGESLDKNGKVIDKTLLKNWNNPRCLVESG